MGTATSTTQSFAQSVLTLLRIFFAKKSAVHTDPTEGLDYIRKQLKDILQSTDHGKASSVYVKVSSASDVQQLWYLRADVMDAVAKTRGESAAKSELNALNDSFRALLPKGLATRPSPLDV